MLNPLCMKPLSRVLERRQSEEEGRCAEVSSRVLDPVDNRKRQLYIPGTGLPWLPVVPGFLVPSVYLSFSGHPQAPWTGSLFTFPAAPASLVLSSLGRRESWATFTNRLPSS